jgi:tetratricopeptide (TPR) repeat protein
MPSPPAPVTSSAPPGVNLERGQTIDRFVVLGLVGRGGMGEVFAAYDPELDRKIAIKLLRARDDAADGRARLLREAQAIAKLSHPNVVVVYDVGTFGESVFIAMEFVEGRTLTGWLQAGQRSRRDVLQVFLAAGRGLSAAHAAGLVHRDFKPDNVMVTNEGQVRVMDFGLARHMGEVEVAAPEPAPPVEAICADAVETMDPNYDPDATMNLRKERHAPPAGSGKYLSIKLTQTGAMLGTPAYMAPEQFAMRPTDERTDQFSFCVALYECLYGQRPFEGETFLALMTSVTTGAVRAAPAKAKVPGWVRNVVVRGLETDPDRRYASMSALLRALEIDPTVRTRRLALGVGLLVCLGLAGFGARRAIGTHQEMCRGGDERWAGIWEANGAPSARKDAVRRAFSSSGKAYAAQAFESSSRLLDDYVRAWLSMYTETCEATHVRGEQSADVLDLRMSCLQDRFNGVSALSDLLARADDTVVENAVSAAGALPRLERCTDVKALRAVIKPPEDAATQKRVDDLRLELARLTAARNSGQCAEAETRAKALIPRARATGYAPLVADTLVAAALLMDHCIEPSLGFERFREGVLTALASGDDEVAATGAMELGGFLADRAGKPVEGRQWLDIAESLLARVGHPALLEAWFFQAQAGTLIAEGRGAEAVTAARRSAGRKEQVLSEDHPDIAISYNTLGNALHAIERDPEALVAFGKARSRFVRALGASHPQVAMVSNNEGEVLNSLHRFPEAHADFQRALDIWASSSSNPIFVSYGLTGLGIALIGEGLDVDAINPLEEALAIRTRESAVPESLGETRFALARALWGSAKDRPRAVELVRRARVDLTGQRTSAAQVTLASVEAWLSSPNARH